MATDPIPKADEPHSAVASSAAKFPREFPVMPESSEPVRILFVDDEQSVLNALKRSMRKEGYKLILTTDVEDALRLIGAEGVDVVVSDHLMPAMTGIEFLALAARLHPSVIRIMLTGQADVDMAIRAINEGQVNRFLTKPWDDAQLKFVLRDAAREVASDGIPPGPSSSTISVSSAGPLRFHPPSKIGVRNEALGIRSKNRSGVELNPWIKLSPDSRGLQSRPRDELYRTRLNLPLGRSDQGNCIRGGGFDSRSG
jgi:CheY-like chemotaxis protein